VSSSTNADRPLLHVESIHADHTVAIVLRGEADIATVDHLEDLLGRIPLNGARSVRIDASGLDFFDVAALRRLTGFADRARQAGREVTTDGARPIVQRMARLLELDEVLGLR
jgi:anti-anti-sigma factor